MQEHDDNSEEPTPSENHINNSKLKVWERQMVIAFIAAASVGLLVCAHWFIQTYITQKPAFEISGYYYLVYIMVGFLILIISLNIAILADLKQKKHDYVSIFIRAVVEAFEYLIW